jgi:hypothetical protein
MPVSSRALVELVLLGPMNDRRQLQDSPILGDVWIAFAARPAAALDLLITPEKDRPAGPVAVLLARRVADLGLPRAAGEEAQVAYLQGLVAARLFFRELVRVVVPMTVWWRRVRVEERLPEFLKERLPDCIETIIAWARAADDEDAQAARSEAFADFNTLDRYATLAGVILWGSLQRKRRTTARGGGLVNLIASSDGPADIVGELRRLFKEILDQRASDHADIWQVSLNRQAMPAVERSVPAVKADAARTLFNVRCNQIRWAVLDSGIDGSHPAFQDAEGRSRVVRAFDFSHIRKIVSLDNLNTRTASFKQRLAELRAGREAHLKAAAATSLLKALAEDADNDRAIHWGMVEPFITIDPATPPVSGHGTHVAGILGARAAAGATDGRDGMCPDIQLYDFRVLAKSLAETEFAIIAALQYIRYLNERQNYISIHGANLSLSIPHDVRNFACGRTPICTECERLVESGVVVVAAAGNFGYRRFQTDAGAYEGYTAFSITDPGNADGVITVGATHRYRPHTYGVSFFSSRGPTGDGRLKPDLVAPGERIVSCLPNGDFGELDGTSMAAPHVSGAAAMLMARYAELIGEPHRIKRILCDSATDLERERSFQGAGMLDVLRAFQRI